MQDAPLNRQPAAPVWRPIDAIVAVKTQIASGDMAPDPGPPVVVAASSRLQCVPFARETSNINIRGHSWTWWNTARGRYERGRHPRVGSVLVFRANGRSRGHLAVVTHITGPREILVSHANWLNRGRVHLNTPVRDVSRGNNWGSVRVWYTPAGIIGKSRYRTRGFIYPEQRTAQAPAPTRLR